MLFSDSAKYTHGLAIDKHIAEILVKDDYQAYKALEGKKTLDSMMKYAEEIGEDDSFTVLTSYMLNVLNWDPPYVERLRREFSLFLVDFQEVYLPRDYLVVPEAENAVRNTIASYLWRDWKVSITDSDWSQIFLALRQYVGQTACNFSYNEYEHQIIGWLVSSAGFFIKDFPNHILETLTSVGLNQEIEGKDFTAIDYQSEELSYAKDLEKFDLLASNIYKVSDFAYRHNSHVYYDLFSRYKFMKVRQHRDEIEKNLQRRFKFATLRTGTEFVDANFNIMRSSSDTAKLKLTYRDQILHPLDKLIEGKAGLSELNNIFRDILRENAFVIMKHRKDKAPLFDGDEYVSRDEYDTDTKLEFLYQGAIALKKFLVYLKENQIDVFSVPSKIFRDERYIPRFPTFKRYMEFLEQTEALIKEEPNNNELVSNDRVYADLMKQSSRVINNIPLKSIKDVIDNLTSYPEPEEEDEEDVNEFDENILHDAWKRYSIFTTSQNQGSLQGKYVAESSKSESIKTFIMGKGWLEQDVEFWLLPNPKITPEGFFDALYKKNEEQVNRALLFRSLSREEGSHGFLGYFRSLEFIRVFLEYVRELLSVTYVTHDRQKVTASSQFKIFLIINENRELFNVVKKPSHYSEFSDLLDRYNFEYYVGEDTEERLLNDHLIKMYDLMYNGFGKFLDYIRHLHQTVFYTYSEGVVLDVKEDTAVKEVLKKIAVMLYHTASPINKQQYPYFERLLNFSEVDEYTGFVMRDGSFYKEIVNGNFRYVHESGNWVTLTGNNDYEVDRISPQDRFDRQKL